MGCWGLLGWWHFPPVMKCGIIPENSLRLARTSKSRNISQLHHVARLSSSLKAFLPLPLRPTHLAPSYDVVIVGGGSAGAHLAYRLSEDCNRQVLLLEAGRQVPWWIFFEVSMAQISSPWWHGAGICTPTKWGPQTIAKLVNITPMSLWFMVLITN